MHWHVNLCSRARCPVQGMVALIQQCTCILRRLAAVAYNVHNSIDHTTSNSILSGIMELNWNEKEHEKHEAHPKKQKTKKKHHGKNTWCAHRQTARTASAFFGFNDFCFSFHQTKRTSTGKITRNTVQVCTLLHESRVSSTKEANAAQNRYTQIDGTRLRVVIIVSLEHTHTQQREEEENEKEASRIFRWCITLNESIWLFFRLHFLLLSLSPCRCTNTIRIDTCSIFVIFQSFRCSGARCSFNVIAHRGIKIHSTRRSNERYELPAIRCVSLPFYCWHRRTDTVHFWVDTELR